LKRACHQEGEPWLCPNTLNNFAKVTVRRKAGPAATLAKTKIRIIHPKECKK
jgi:hypothetical protein